MEGLLEYKSIFNGHVKDVDKSTRTITGYFSAYGNVDSDNDVIEKGAYSKTIKERAQDIYYLFNHNWDYLMDKGSRSLKLIDDNYGLGFEAKIADTNMGRDLIVYYEEGLVNEHSIGFQTQKAVKEANGVRVIKEVKLWEGSAVPIGANGATPFNGFKSVNTIKEANDYIHRIMKLLKNGSLTDDSFSQLEFALKQLQLESYELGKQEIKSTQEIQEPSKDTPEIIIEPQVIKSIFNQFTI